MPPPSSITTTTGWSNVTTITQGSTTITTVVDVFVSYCAEVTTFTVNDVCYTATTPGQYITVTDCPCTVETVSVLSLFASPLTQPKFTLVLGTVRSNTNTLLPKRSAPHPTPPAPSPRSLPAASPPPA